MPRKTKLTPEVYDFIVKSVAAGNYYAAAVRACGINEQTANKWLDKGRKAKSGLFYEFARDVDKAAGMAEVRVVATMSGVVQKVQNDPKLWPAAMTFLERKFPDRWGKRAMADVKVDGKIQHEHSVIEVPPQARTAQEWIEQHNPDPDANMQPLQINAPSPENQLIEMQIAEVVEAEIVDGDDSNS